MDEHNSDIEQKSTGANHREKHFETLKAPDPASSRLDELGLPELKPVETEASEPAVIEPIAENKHLEAPAESAQVQGLSPFTQWLLTRTDSSQ